MLRRQGSSLWAALGILLIHLVGGAPNNCLDSGWCRDMETEAEVEECLRACRTGLSEETPVFPGNGHLQPLSESIRKYVMSHFRWNEFGKGNGTDPGHKREEFPHGPAMDALPARGSWETAGQGDLETLERQEGKRSYAMEHFRWGKPVGRKRRPVKVYPTAEDGEEELAESYPQEFRRDLSWEANPELGSPEENGEGTRSEEEEEEGGGPQPWEAKKDGTAYKMRHFRWNVPAPPKKKRYGGFMSPERSHTPLVTLFKNAIVKTAYKKGQ
ncbi:pro-opiomelanocortin [Podarcis raffonei]|uniref:pro-opiomelanocortin n=1 Tax=Podarcis raffonei TaxID=65483 RepID=UPI002329235D|nr:pro-opiomelanocortin [Podarcis raffonei]